MSPTRFAHRSETDLALLRMVDTLPGGTDALAIWCTLAHPHVVTEYIEKVSERAS